MIVEPLPAWRYHVRQVVAAVLFMALLLAGLHIFGEVLSWFGVEGICAEDPCYDGVFDRNP